MAWLMDQGAKPPKRSPMDYPDAAQAVAAQPDANPDQPAATPTPEVPDDRPKDLHVTAIIGDGSRSLASINHKVRRIGEQIAPGWKIFSIDSKHRTVVLRHTDGRKLTISPDKAGE